jgi:predicted nucleic acid-binding protein
MADNLFLDTNIFVYAYTADDGYKNRISCDLLRSSVMKNITISVQVLSEFYATMAKYKCPHKQIAHYVEEIATQVEVSHLSLRSVEYCLHIKDKYHYSWWDSLVLTSALESACSILYSEDLQHGQIIESVLKIVNPFVE